MFLVRLVPWLLVSLLASGCGGATGSAEGTTARDRALPRSYAEAARRGDELGYTRRAAHELGRVRGIGARADGPRTLLARSTRGDSHVSLDRPYAACANDLTSCDDVTTSYLASVAEQLLRSEDDLAARPELLRLAVRSEATIASYRSHVDGEILARPLVAALHVLVLVDFPESARPLLSSELSALGLDEAQAFERARANVLAELGPMPPETRSLEPGSAAGISAGRYYESSRILDTAALSELERHLGAPILLAVPVYDTVLLASGADPMAVLALGQIAAEVAGQSERPLSVDVLRFTEGRLELAR